MTGWSGRGWTTKTVKKKLKNIMKKEIRSVELKSLSNATFSFGTSATWRSSSSKSVQNFIEIGWFFAEIWRYIDFQNGGRPPSWNCFATIRDHPQSLCCWLQLPVKFHVNLIHRSEDLFEFFTYLAWNVYSGLQTVGFGGLLTPKWDYSSLRPPKGTSLHKSASFKPSNVKIC